MTTKCSRMLGDLVLLNPCKGLKKGKEYPFVEMSSAACSNRHPLSIERKAYDRGTAFDEGDTLIACIEPCLENGKGFRAEGIGIGFASREFIALRTATDDLDSVFLYYMMESLPMLNAMSRIMTGELGRRRVDRERLRNIMVCLPSLSAQQEAVELLTLLDDSVHNLIQRTDCAQQIIKSAWEMALAKCEPRSVRISEICHSVRKYSDCSQVTEEAIYIASEHMRRGSIFVMEPGCAADVTGRRLTFERGDVLLPRIRPENCKAAVATGKGVTADSVVVLRPNCAAYAGAIAMIVSSPEFIACASSTARKGTVMHRIDMEMISDCLMRIPCAEALEWFNGLYRHAVSLNCNALASMKRMKLIKELVMRERFKDIVP